MKNVLAIDIGNTNITVGIFEKWRLIRKMKMPTKDYSLYHKRLKTFIKRCGLDMKDVERVIVSSVVPPALRRLARALNKIGNRKVSIVGKDIKVPIENLYRIKKEVGQDRLVGAFAALMMYGSPCVVIDFGTAITFDIVSKRGQYLGGLILPGIEISLASLYEKTALLPKVKLKDAPYIIGKDTKNSMRGGILFGFGAMCDGLVSRYKKILGNDTKIIATGGNASLMKKYAKSIQVVDENLTLKGLNLITPV